MKTLTTFLVSNTSTIASAVALALVTSACGSSGGGTSAKPLSPTGTPQKITSLGAVQINSPTGGALLTKTDSTILSGTCSPGSKLTLSGDVSATDVLTPSAALGLSCPSGTFQYKVQKTTDGIYHLKVTQDLDSTEAALVVTRDATAPSAPTLTSPSTANVTTSGSSLSVTGGCETGATVALAGASSQNATCASSAYAFSLSASADGTYDYTINQTDPAGNTSAATALKWIRDSAVPSTLVLTSPASSPILNNLSALTLAGTCTTGMTVAVSGSSTQTQTCAASAFSFNVSASTDGTANYSLIQTNSANGLSSNPVTAQWTRDTVAPSAPALTAPASCPVASGASALTLSGSCEAGATVKLSGADTQTGSCASGAFSFSVSASADGTYNYSLAQTDAAGNASTATAFRWIRDTTPPAAPVVTSPATSPVLNNSSSLTIAGTCIDGMTVNLSGAATQSETCASSSFSFTVTASTDGTFNYGIAQTSAVTGVSSSAVAVQWQRDTVAPSGLALTAPASCPVNSNGSTLALSGTCEIGATVSLTGGASQNAPCTTGTFSFTASQATDAATTYTVGQSDSAGNASPSISCLWNRDTTAPSNPTISSPSTNPFSSGGTSLTLSGGCENGAQVDLSGSSTQNTTCASGTYSFDLAVTTDGTYTYSLKQTDLAGNASSATSFQWIRNNATPSAPVLTSPATNPANNSASSLMIAGTCTSGMTISMNGAASQTQTCNSSAFSMTVTSLVDGAYNYSLVQTNQANGQSSSPVTVRWNRDTAAPAAPAITNPAVCPVTTGDSTFTLSGTCETGATLALSGSDTQSGTCAAGTFSFTSSKSTDGTYSYSIAQTDAAGNASPATSCAWTRDSTVPASPVLSQPAATPFYSSGSALTIAGTCVTGYTVELDGDSTQTMTCASGAFSFDVSATTDATYDFEVDQVNAADTPSNSIQVQWIRDTAAPLAPTITMPATSPFTSSGSLTLTGACEVGAQVQLYGDDSQTMSCGSGTYSFAISKSTDGTYSFSVKQTDLAGNVSSARTMQWVRDSSVPPSPVLASPAIDPYLSNTGSITLSGSCSDGMTVTLSGDVHAADVTSPSGSLTQTCAASSFTYLVAKTTDATYNFSVTQTNASGIVSGADSVRWIRDTVAPTVTIATSPANPNLKADGSFTFSSNESGSTLECQLDSGAWAACASPLTYTAMTNGARTFGVRATDAAGNVSTPATKSWAQSAYNALALYHMDSSAPAADSSSFVSPNLNTLTTNTGTANASTSVSAAYNQGVTFSGSGLMSAPDSASFGSISSKLTAEAYIKFTSVPSSGSVTIMGQNGSSSGSYGWEIRLTKSSSKYKIQFIGSVNGTTTKTISASSYSSTTYTGGFHHLAVTFNSGTVKIYWDGAQIGTGTVGTAGSAVLFNTTTAFRIGQNAAGSNKMNATIDEVRISQTVRYSAAFTKPSTPFTAD